MQLLASDTRQLLKAVSDSESISAEKLAGAILRQIPERSLKQRMIGMQMSNSFREKFIKCDF